MSETPPTTTSPPEPEADYDNEEYRKRYRTIQPKSAEASQQASLCSMAVYNVQVTDVSQAGGTSSRLGQSGSVSLAASADQLESGQGNWSGKRKAIDSIISDQAIGRLAKKLKKAHSDVARKSLVEAGDQLPRQENGRILSVITPLSVSAVRR